MKSGGHENSMRSSTMRLRRRVVVGVILVELCLCEKNRLHKGRE